MATATALTPAQLLAELQELVRLATQYAALESRIESKAKELEESDWIPGIPSRFRKAVYGAIAGALEDAQGGDGSSDFDGLQLCASVQDAIEVLAFAVERDDAR
jgi:transposase